MAPKNIKLSANSAGFAVAETERLKQRTKEAFFNGRLVIRRINQHDGRYIKSDIKNPRPGSYIKFNQRVDGLSEKQNDNIYAGLTEVTPLVMYKCDAVSDRIFSGATIDNLGYKTLSSVDRLWEKLEEQQQRQLHSSCYQPMTSGRLDVNNQFTLPKQKKINSEGVESKPGVIPHNEVIMSEYGPENITCIVVVNGASQPCSPFEIIRKIKQLEYTLGVREGLLPIAFYAPELGKLTVHTQEELLGSVNCEEIDQKEEMLARVRGQLDIPQYRLNELLRHLSPDDCYQAFFVLNAEVLNKLKSNEQIRQEFNDFLALNNENPTVKDLQAWIDKGFNPYGRTSELGVNKESSLLDLYCKKMYDRESRYYKKTPDVEERAGAQILVEQLLRYGVKSSSIVEGFQYGEPAEVPVYLRKYIHAQEPYFYESVFDVWKCFRTFARDPSTGALPSFEILLLNAFLQARAISASELIETFTNRSLVDAFNPEALTEKFAVLRRFCTTENDPQKQGSKETALLKEATLSALKRIQKSSLTYGPINKKRFGCYEKVYGHQSPEAITAIIMQCWENAQYHPLYTNWDEAVEQAQKEIDDIKETIGIEEERLSFSCPVTPDEALSFITDLYRKPPSLTGVMNFDDKVLAILDYYYRSPDHEGKVLDLIKLAEKKVQKTGHNCSHALRVMNNATCYMELLQSHGMSTFSAQEKELLALASVYHDAAAENVGKAEEEIRMVEFFCRDLGGLYPKTLLADVAEALRRKEDDVNGQSEQPSEPVRKYLRVLRFADRLDSLRFVDMGADFPRWHPNATGDSARTTFNSDLLDIDAAVMKKMVDSGRKNAFQQSLEAFMHGATNLAVISGADITDIRANAYQSSYSLQVSLSGQAEVFETSQTPVTLLNDAVDDNVRRYIARQASINTCSDPEHTHCRPDTQAGKVFGIHSLQALRQIDVPECLTQLEKMQIEHNEMLLSESSRQAVSEEVTRLRSSGIDMSLGGLQQKVLRKADVQKRLLETRGLKVETKNIKTGDGYTARLFTSSVPQKSQSIENAPTEMAAEPIGKDDSGFLGSWCNLI